jgi:hypothetical protein
MQYYMLHNSAFVVNLCHGQQRNVFRSSCKVRATTTECGFPRQIFVEIPNVKFHINLSSGSRADKDMRKLTDAFGDCANTPVKSASFSRIIHLNKGKLNIPSLWCI